MMKKLLFMISFLFISTSVFASNAVSFVEKLTDTIITDVLKSNKNQEEKEQVFKTEFEKALDLKSIGQFVLGPYWRTATPEQKEKFLSVFMDLTTTTWGNRFQLYQGQELIFSGERPAPGKQIYVDSKIMNNPPVEVIWRLKNKDGAYKIIDIIVEGASMAISYKTEYITYIQNHNNDLNVLTEALSEKLAKLKEKKN